MITFESVYVTFNHGKIAEKKALRGLSFHVKEREFVTLIGGNGAGKSTLMNVLCGEIFAQKGRVFIGGHNVTRLPSWKRAGMVARVFQDPMAGTCGELTIEENIALAFRRGEKRRFIPALTAEHRAFLREQLSHLGLGLEMRMHHLAKDLSGGQRQALSLAMATLKPAKILVLDEHTAALDPKAAHQILDLTHKIIEERKLTALMITHSMEQALAFGSRTFMLHEGRLLKDIHLQERGTMKESDLANLFYTATHQVI